LDYKLIICGTSGVGKTWIQKHFFHGLSHDVLDRAKLGPTTETFSYPEKPYKLGHLNIFAVDTGGQVLLRKKLHGEKRELCFIGTDACIYVIDIASSIVKYEEMKEKDGEGSDAFIWKQLDEVKRDLENVINSIYKFAIPNANIRLIILFHKWDLLDDFPRDVRDAWKVWLTEQLFNVDGDCKINLLKNGYSGKIKFLGFETSSVLDNSCKIAIRKVLPRQEQLQRLLSAFISKCKLLGANKVYISALNQDGLEYAALQHPYLMNTEPLYEYVIKYCYPALNLRNELESEDIISLHVLHNPDYLIMIKPLTEELSLSLVTDIIDVEKVRLLTKEMDETLKNIGNLIEIYYS
jgi:GTPase SAR1 family protein